MLKNGEPSEVRVTPGVTDGQITEITGGDLTADTPVIVSVKPSVKES